MNSATTRDRIRELEAENRRLRSMLDRKTDATTIRVELPSEENGLAFYVTCHGEGMEQRCMETLVPTMEMFASVLDAKVGDPHASCHLGSGTGD